MDSNGTITTTKGLDYESVKEFEFYIVANDGGRFFEANKDYVTHLRITLRDINDNDPVFLNAPYFANIMENQTAAVLVYQVCKKENQVLESAMRPLSYVKTEIEGEVCVLEASAMRSPNSVKIKSNLAFRLRSLVDTLRRFPMTSCKGGIPAINASLPLRFF